MATSPSPMTDALRRYYQRLVDRRSEQLRELDTKRRWLEQTLEEIAKTDCETLQSWRGTLKHHMDDVTMLRAVLDAVR